MPSLRLLACLSLAVVAFGCGAEDQPAANTAATAEATPDAAADERVAKDAAVRIDDLPSGWQQEGGGENFESPCAPIQEASKLADARYTSPRFSTGDGPLTLNVVYVFPDDAAAQRGFELISSEETEDCTAELTVAGLASDDDVEIGATEKRALPIDPLGDQFEATRVTVPISGHALEMDLTTDVVITRVGRGVTVNSFIHGSGRFDADLRDQISTSTVQRLTTGLA